VQVFSGSFTVHLSIYLGVCAGELEMELAQKTSVATHSPDASESTSAFRLRHIYSHLRAFFVDSPPYGGAHRQHQRLPIKVILLRAKEVSKNTRLLPKSLHHSRLILICRIMKNATLLYNGFLPWAVDIDIMQEDH